MHMVLLISSCGEAECMRAGLENERRWSRPGLGSMFGGNTWGDVHQVSWYPHVTMQLRRDDGMQAVWFSTLIATMTPQQHTQV